MQNYSLLHETSLQTFMYELKLFKPKLFSLKTTLIDYYVAVEKPFNVRTILQSPYFTQKKKLKKYQVTTRVA